MRVRSAVLGMIIGAGVLALVAWVTIVGAVGTTADTFRRRLRDDEHPTIH